MEQVHVELGDRSYTVFIAPDLFEGGLASSVLEKHLRGRRVLLVADSHTAPLYAERVLAAAKAAGAASCGSYIIPAGEQNKTFATTESICCEAVRQGLDRDSVFLALGGGVTTDLTGFAASIYMRGVSFISIPSSLLAMIDAGIGGKTGADLPGGKNLIGTFWQPKAVLMDVSFLRTLPEKERRCGAAELLKHAILFDSDFFARLEETASGFLEFGDPGSVARQIAWSCRLKAAVVSGDERESGRRALLNFGHTFGHAAERLMNFTLSHGEAVAWGMAAASDLALDLNLIRGEENTRIRTLIERFGLPLRLPGLSPDAVLESMRSDKKSRAGKIRLILPLGIGKADIFRDIPEERILRAIEAHCD